MKRVLVNELYESDLGSIALSLTDLQDAHVAPFTVSVSRTQVLEELLQRFLIANSTRSLPPGMQITAPRQRDEPLCKWTQLFRFGRRGLDALMLEEAHSHVREHRLPVARRSA